MPIAIGVSQSTMVYLSEHKAMFPGYRSASRLSGPTPTPTPPPRPSAIPATSTNKSSRHWPSTATRRATSSARPGSSRPMSCTCRGKPGSEVIDVDALGNAVGTASTKAPVSGDDLVLNMDLHLQSVVENALTNQINRLQGQGLPADGGAAVVLDPQTGAVLAMASVPTYNPSWWVGGISDHHYQLLTSQADHDPLLNRAIQGSWAPGSTFKPRPRTAALNDGLLNSLGGYINDPGSYQIPPPCSGQCTYYDNINNGVAEAGKGELDVTQALAVSDDVFFYTLGAGLLVRLGQIRRDTHPERRRRVRLRP